MKEITYSITLNINTDFAGTTVIETRSIKREIVEGESTTVEVIKAVKREYSIKELDNRIKEKMGNESSLYIAEEISFEEFKNFMDESRNLCSIDLTRFKL